jgi:polyisoprenyl-teichoic acid--peptidoglycan teichoic acid transferase
MANKKPIDGIQTGRNLPHRFNSYSPTSRSLNQPEPPKPPGPLPKPKPSKQKYLVNSFLTLLIGLVVLTLLVGIWDARNISAAERKMFGTGNLFSLLNSSALKGSSTGRVNILLVGYSVDDPGHPGANLTDSIILLSMSTTKHTGYMLSIPRDLYVKIPGFGYGKINEAYQDGGVSLLEQVVTSDFQVPINYYALIDYAAVRDTVNALGGITVNVQSPDPRGLYDPNISPKDGGPLKLNNGPQILGGQTALNLTRARGDAYGSYGFPQADFDRTQHQRQVLTAIKAKLNWKLVINPSKNNKILNAVAGNVKTDIEASEIRPIFGLFNRIPSSSLQSIGLRDFNGQNYLNSYTTVYGASALVPTAGINDYSEIDAILQQLN